MLRIGKLGSGWAWDGTAATISPARHAAAAILLIVKIKKSPASRRMAGTRNT
jgi:hypothetical protein